MLDRQTYPLEIARKVLKPETINDVRSGGYTSLGYSILDRWALNSPEELKKLEAMGTLDLLVTLDQQATIENRALSSETSRQASLRGMSDSEIWKVWAST